MSLSAGECGVKDQVSCSGPPVLGERTAVLDPLGPTASGKTALAIELASVLGGVELVSVDAIAVYRGLDIGSAKPTAAEQAAARWHLIDVVEPTEEFSVSRFVTLATEARSDIEARSHRVGFVGGTGLYHRAVVGDLALAGRYPEVAAELERQADGSDGLAALYRRLGELDPIAQGRVEPANRRRIIRALEVTIGSGTPFSSSGPGLEHYPRSEAIQIGLVLERDELDRRIAARLEAQLAAGFVEEVAGLLSTGGLSRTARQALGYRELIVHLEQGVDLEETRMEILSRTRRFARRQLSWFRRDPRIVWLDATRSDLVQAAAQEVLAGGAPGKA